MLLIFVYCTIEMTINVMNLFMITGDLAFLHSCDEDLTTIEGGFFLCMTKRRLMM